MSTVPELDVARARRYVDDLNGNRPDHARDQVRFELELGPATVTIVECRPPWRAEAGTDWTRSPVAQLRYSTARGEWRLHCPDRNGRFRLYSPAPATPVISGLLEEITADPTGIFWG